jgi:5-deoxy-glucuronate isomerase
VSSLLVQPPVTPDSAGWSYVGFEVVRLRDGERLARETGERELCLVVVEGRCDVRSEHGEWRGLGGRSDPFSGLPDAAYLPPGTAFELQGRSGKWCRS